MDESFPFPDGEPSDEWKVEELLHWLLHQCQNQAREATEQMIASLRSQCERECEDIMTLHSLAVDASNMNISDGADEENLDPQPDNAAASATGTTDKGATTSSAAAASVADTKPSSSSSSKIEIQVIAGPHSSSKYLLNPNPECPLGRSQEEIVIENGICLHKDNKVSTIHGKFVVEDGLASFSSSERETETVGLKFYYIDLGSTNGTVHDGKKLQPNERLLLNDGMELKVGNSVLKVVLG